MGAVDCAADSRHRGQVGAAIGRWKDQMTIVLDAAVGDDTGTDHVTSSAACWLVAAAIAWDFGDAGREVDSFAGGVDDFVEVGRQAAMGCRPRTQTEATRIA